MQVEDVPPFSVPSRLPSGSAPENLKEQWFLGGVRGSCLCPTSLCLLAPLSAPSAPSLSSLVSSVWVLEGVTCTRCTSRSRRTRPALTLAPYRRWVAGGMSFQGHSRDRRAPRRGPGPVPRGSRGHGGVAPVSVLTGSALSLQVLQGAQLIAVASSDPAAAGVDGSPLQGSDIQVQYVQLAPVTDHTAAAQVGPTPRGSTHPVWIGPGASAVLSTA